jgi:hypothetical protein
MQQPEIYGNISKFISWSPPVEISNLNPTEAFYRNIERECVQLCSLEVSDRVGNVESPAIENSTNCRLTPIGKWIPRPAAFV